MKRLLYTSVFTLIAFSIIFSCSDGEDDSPPPDIVQTLEQEATQYTIIVTVGEGGTVSSSGGTYDEGQSVNLIAIPQEGYNFIGWTGDVSHTDVNLTLTVNSDISVTAVFEQSIQQFSLTVSSSVGGTVSEQSGNYDAGTAVSIEATPNQGFDFLRWHGIESSSASITITVNTDTELQALFVPQTFFDNRESIELCKLDKINVNNGVSFGYPRYNYSLQTKGDIKVTLIFVDFNDSPATKSISDVKTEIETVSKNYFSLSSYGKLNVEFDAINKWLRMSKNSDEYNMRREINSGEFHHSYLTEALSLADSEYDFSTSDLFVVITNPDTQNIDYGPAFVGDDFWNFQADGKTFYTSTNSGYDFNYWGALWLNHETFHLMGLPDLYNSSGDPTWHGYVGEFSLMGLISCEAPDLFGYEKWMLDWVEEAQIFCAQSGFSIVDISPVSSQDNNTKILVLPISESKSIVVESRRANFLDSSLSEEGILVYQIDLSKNSGQGTLEVLPANRSDEDKIGLLMEEGEELIIENYKVEVLANFPSYDRIRVTRQ